MIPEIDIWRAASLRLKRYGDKALEQNSARFADELAADGDHDGADTWRRITSAVAQLTNTNLLLRHPHRRFQGAADGGLRAIAENLDRKDPEISPARARQ